MFSSTSHWALSTHFKRALDFHLGVLTVKWYTLKIARTSTSKCCSCYYSRLRATQPLVRRGGSQDRAEQVAERRPLSTLKPPQAVGLLPQGKPLFKVHRVRKSHLAACVAADCSFSQFPQALPLAQSLIHLLFFFSQSPERGSLPSLTVRLCPTNMVDFLT